MLLIVESTFGNIYGSLNFHFISERVDETVLLSLTLWYVLKTTNYLNSSMYARLKAFVEKKKNPVRSVLQPAYILHTSCIKYQLHLAQYASLSNI